MAALRILFTVQGDGRGHLTQALAASRIAREAGAEVVAVVVGHSHRQTIPAFFRDKIHAPVVDIDSLELIADSRNRAISPVRTIVGNVKQSPKLLAGLKTLAALVRQLQPDVVVNFFEPLTGLAFRWFRLKPGLVCLGNQYIHQHPAFVYPPQHQMDRRVLIAYSQLTVAPKARVLGMSFQPLVNIPGRLRVMPPLLRAEVFAKPFSSAEDFILVYLLKNGLLDEIRSWHTRHPHVRLHCFSDQPQATPEVTERGTLTFHSLNDEKFLTLMSQCKGLICTSGFQSLSEAMWFGKPIFAVPVANHYEQLTNAWNVAETRTGIWSPTIDLDRFLNYLPTHKTDPEPYRGWVKQAGQILMDELHQAHNGH